ncbi:hypothetical protein [Algiphilus sp.]|uniref:hypothetical protein n=1 Tax=Algiphilus sp. TaxID=1872431 RepID=UPI003B529ADF
MTTASETRTGLSALRALALALFMGVGSIALLSGCDSNDGPAEEMGESIDEAAEEAGDAMEEAGDEMEETADEMEDSSDY